MVRASMVIFRSMVDALRGLEPIEFYSVMLGMIDYAMDDIEPEFPTTLETALFLSFKSQIDANKRKFEAQVENGKKGGRPKKENPTKPKETQENPTKPNKTQVKPYMRNEKGDMRNEIDNTSSSSRARETESFHIPDDIYEKIMAKMHRG